MRGQCWLENHVGDLQANHLDTDDLVGLRVLNDPEDIRNLLFVVATRSVSRLVLLEIIQ